MSNEKLKNREKRDKASCKLISESIGKIVRLSMDEDFRNQSFELFGVRSTALMERQINNKLNLMIQQGRPKKKYIKQNRKNKKNMPKSPVEILESQTTDLENITAVSESSSSSSKTNIDFENFSKNNICKRNWLKISKEKHKEDTLNSCKRKCYSQPLPDVETSVSNSESFLSEISVNMLTKSFDSEISITKSQSEESKTSTEAVPKEFYKKKFKQSLHESQLYFRKNVSSCYF